MNKYKTIGLIIITGILFIGCTSVHQKKVNAVKKQIDSIIQDPVFSGANFGILIESLNDEEILYEYNSDKLFIPASNQKIITSAAALLVLGSEYKYETKLFCSGEIVDSVLIGDLIVQGTGDPTFNINFYNDHRKPFYDWADSLLTKGITKISGNIIGDDNIFDDKRFGAGWMLEDIGKSYAAEISALQFNDNSITLTISPPDKQKSNATIIPEFHSSYFSINNLLTSNPDENKKLRVVNSFNSNQINISGNLLFGDRIRRRTVSIYNPTLYFVTVLNEIFTEKGIEIEGEPLDCDDIEDWNFDQQKYQLLLTHFSPPLNDIIQICMKKSNNLYAETFLKTIGYHKYGVGSFQTGKAVVDSLLFSWKIAPESYSFRDGSGLSRYNLISAAQLVKTLKKMRMNEQWQNWQPMFPVAGLEGTLEDRFRNTSLVNIMKAKTGSMGNIYSLSGYISSVSEDDLVFSILINGHLSKTEEIDLKIAKLLDQIVLINKMKLKKN